MFLKQEKPEIYDFERKKTLVFNEKYLEKSSYFKNPPTSAKKSSFF